MILLDFMLHIQVHIGMDQSASHPGMSYEFIFKMLSYILYKLACHWHVQLFRHELVKE